MLFDKIARRGQKTGRTADHTCCWQGTWYIMLDESEMKNTLGRTFNNPYTPRCAESYISVPCNLELKKYD